MAKGQPEVPKFLSTHPQNHDRQERLQSHMEEVDLLQITSHNRHVKRALRPVAGIRIANLARDSETACGEFNGPRIFTLLRALPLQIALMDTSRSP
jgi:hypothetical protein